MPLVGRRIETTSDNFGPWVGRNALLVDKTLMIKEFLEGQKVSLIVFAPVALVKRSICRCYNIFFAAEVTGRPTAGLFDAFAIAREEGGQWMEHQGKYPVIYVSFKDVKESSYERTIAKNT